MNNLKGMGMGMNIFRGMLYGLLFIGAQKVEVRAFTLDYDAGFRAAIYDENYNLGLGGELGAIANLNSAWDAALHLNYSHYSARTQTWSPADEYGGYLTAYYLPNLDQPFRLRIGPHLGTNYITSTLFTNLFLDIGADMMAAIPVAKNFKAYASFSPSFLIGSEMQSIYRIGVGIEFCPGGSTWIQTAQN